METTETKVPHRLLPIITALVYLKGKSEVIPKILQSDKTTFKRFINETVFSSKYELLKFNYSFKDKKKTILKKLAHKIQMCHS